MSLAGQITPATVFVASGGARGITARCVLAMAQAYRCRFVLLGRSDKRADPAWAAGCSDEAELKRRIASELASNGSQPAPRAIQQEFGAIMAAREIEATLVGIAAAGGRAEYVSFDLADAPEYAGPGAAPDGQGADRLSAILRETAAELGAIEGLIHGAGALSDRPIERKTARDFDAVYASKVRSLQRLLGCLPVEQLRFLFLFSSAAGFFGNPGQSDYALSNEILNRVAQRVKHHNPACKVVSFNWGPWDMGMVTPELRRLFVARGIEPIAVEAGTRAFLSMLDRDDAPALVLVGDGLGQEPAAPREASQRSSRAIPLAANPFLEDHRVGEHRVLPATCAMSWLASAAEQLCPRYRLARIEGFQVLRGLVFDQTLAERHTLELARAEAADSEIALTALVRSQLSEDGAAAYHYRARLALSDDEPPAPWASDWSLAEDGRAVNGEVLYGNGTLFHGRVFRGIERLLNADERRLTIRCRLPAIDDQTQGQFQVGTLNPFTLDLHYQGLVVWCRLFHDIAGLPLSVEQVLHYRHLPFDTTFYVTVHISSVTDYQVLANTTAHDSQGLAYSEFQGASLTLSRELNEKFAAAVALS